MYLGVGLGPGLGTAGVPSLASLLQGLLGPWLSPAQMTALGAPFSTWESEFAAAADEHYTAQGTDPTQGDATGSSGGNYYGRTKVFYVWYARTGDADTLAMARAQGAAFVDWVMSSAYGDNVDAGVRFIDPEGTVAYMLDMTATGNTTEAGKALNALGRQANMFDSWYADFASAVSGHVSDNRERAYMLRALFWAAKYSAPSTTWTSSPGGYSLGSSDYRGAGSWTARLATQLSLLLAQQEVSGRWGIDSKPFMTGLLHDALILLYEHDTALSSGDRSAIQTAIKTSLDFIWTNQWAVDGPQSFQYTQDTGDADYGQNWPALDALISAGFGWLAGRLAADGDNASAIPYRWRHNLIMTGAEAGVDLHNPKEFNQHYASSFKGPSYQSAVSFPAPGAIADLTAGSATDTTLTLTYTTPTNATSLTYQMRVQGAGSWGAETDLPADGVITGLTVETTYEFQVRGSNETGTASWSNTASGLTTGTTPLWSITSADLVLSNTDHTITNPDANWRGGASNTVHSAGKKTFKVTVAHAISNVAIGLSQASWNTAPFPPSFAGATGTSAWYSDGSVYMAGAVVATVASYAVGDDLYIHTDADNKTIWFQKGAAGFYNNSGSANPATNTGGISISSLTGSLTALLFVAGAADSLTADFAPTETKPSGFSNWG